MEDGTGVLVPLRDQQVPHRQRGGHLVCDQIQREVERRDPEHGSAREPPDQPQPPTFRLFDRQWGPEPGACDFAWVSDSLRGHVRGWAVDSDTRLSDHQPVLLQLD